MAVKFVKKSSAPLRVYRFGPVNEGDASMKEVLGGKGAGLAEMVGLGVNVPPGFIIPCEASITYQDSAKDPEKRKDFLIRLMKAVAGGVQYLEDQFGYMPLISVRSGARVSMPGMMDTILNVGLTPDSLPEWEKRIGVRAARDSMRRLMQMYGSVALGIPLSMFEKVLAEQREAVGVATDAELNEDSLSRVIKTYSGLYTAAGKKFPTDFAGQLTGAIRAVFDSWNNPRAIEYRKINSIPYGWGTAVTIQSMVFGNMNAKSCTGVLFTRNPSTGVAEYTGDWLPDAQGEDVVAGIRDTFPIPKLGEWNGSTYFDLINVADKLEAHYKDMQDIEFTVQDGILYILQTRTGKRSAAAAFKIAHDLCLEGTITKEVALSRVSRQQLLAAMSDSIDPKFKVKPDLVGLAAGGSIVSGAAMFSSDDAVNCSVPCILVTKETDPDDIAGMNAAVGILTATGGMTSHAAVVARSMNKACVVGASNLSIPKVTVSPPTGIIKDGPAFKKGDKITIDGTTGNVWVKTDVPVIAGGGTPELRKMVAWSIEFMGNTAERLDVDSSDPMKSIMESLKSIQSTKLYIDTAVLEREGQVTLALSSIGQQLDGLQFSEVVVDMSPLDSYWGPEDSAFNLMFAKKSETEKVAIEAAKVAGLLNWSKSVVGRTLVLAPHLSKNSQGSLLGHGFKVIGQSVDTFSDLLNANGYVQVSDSVIQSVFGGKKAYMTAVDLVQKMTGKALFGAPPMPMYWHEAIGEK